MSAPARASAPGCDQAYTAVECTDASGATSLEVTRDAPLDVPRACAQPSSG